MAAASLRGFGNRIARIFTRKKDRHLESSKSVNERNQKTLADSNKAQVIPNTVPGPEYVTNPLHDVPMTEEQFQKCTSFSPKSKHHSDKAFVESTNFEPLGNSLAHMEAKPKDVNQLYREMEEAVAQKVRETMELADERRRALAQKTLAANRREVTPCIDQRKDKQEVAEINQVLASSTELVNNQTKENEDAIRIQEIVDYDDHLKKEEIQQEFQDINRSIEEEQAKMYRVADHQVKDVESRAKETQNISQTAVEHCTTTASTENDNTEEKQLDTAIVPLNHPKEVIKVEDTHEEIQFTPPESVQNFDEQKSQIGFEHFEDLFANDPPYQQSDDKHEYETIHKLAQGILNLAKEPIRSTENISQGPTDSRRVTPIITNNPFDLIEGTDAELRRLGENALNLAETSARNYSTNPFESSDDEVEIRLGQGTISMVQNDWRNQTQNPFKIIDDPADIRQLGEEALIIAQNSSRNYTTNPFGTVGEEEMRQIGTDALSIAQSGARNIEAAKRQLSENAEDVDNVFNSLIDSTDLHNPIVEIGFDHLQHTLEAETGDIDEENRQYN